jgi:hypothetical protein
VIELGIVHRMTRKGLLVAPVLVAVLWIWGGPEAALSGAVGLAMAVANLWLAARIIGGVADNNPGLLVAAGLLALALGLAALTAVALGLQALEMVSFPVTGFTLIGAHFVLVLWEASGAYSVKKVPVGDDALKIGS